jgi:peptidoglycan-associated lipoprotein
MEEEARLAEERLYQERQAQMEAALRDKFVNEDIHFEFDKSRLLPEAKEILQEKAEWLSMHEDATVTIEGHCDERGTNEYNLALGDRRAESAKSFLTDLGISASRLTTVSYGEERPMDPRRNEEAWAKNRRAHFVID